MYSMVYEAEEIISTSSSQEMIKLLGALVQENWELKKKLSSQVSNQKIENIYERAINAGAHGGKLCGAGGGGFLVFLVDEKYQNAVRKALPDLLEVQFLFEDQGSSIIYLKV